MSNYEMQECTCPHCGCEMPLHGDIDWEDGPASTDIDGYFREFDGTSLLESYTCDECGGEWNVTRYVREEYAKSPITLEPFDFNTLCPECDVEEVDDTDWGEETIVNNCVEVDMACRVCGAEWIAVYELDEPEIEAL